jgi:hypothetical protein
MNRRDFFRALGWCVVAVLAGEPIVNAWAAALARARRRQMILDQMTYQASKAMEVILRREYVFQKVAWSASDDDYTAEHIVIATDL